MKAFVGFTLGMLVLWFAVWHAIMALAAPTLFAGVRLPIGFQIVQWLTVAILVAAAYAVMMKGLEKK